MRKLRKRVLRASPLLAVLLLAAALLAGGVTIEHREPAQVADYNLAMAAYNKHDIPAAMKYLDRSLADYDAALASPCWQRAIDGRPSAELAAQAHFRKGVLLLAMAQIEKRPGLMGQAVEELEASLELNPGAPYSNKVPQQTATRMNEEALVVKHDLDVLFQKHPEQQNNGKGKPKQGNGQPAQPGPGQNPGDKPGHGNDDGI